MSEIDSNPDMAAIRLAKKELRTLIKARLASSITQDSVKSQSSKITDSLLHLEEYKQARRISVYLSMPRGEVNTPEIVRHAIGSGKRVFVPYFYAVEGVEQLTETNTKKKKKKTLIMDMLELASIRDFEALEPDGWGIPTLSEDSIAGRTNCFGGKGRSVDDTADGEEEHGGSGEGLDLIITPGLAFDRTCGRLGRGKGFYDRFFERCAESAGAGAGASLPFRVGLALTEQVLPDDGESVPMDATDVRLDALVLGDGSVIRRS